jgi:hypothetical protein
MQRTDDLIELEWDGPLAEVGDIPTTLLYGVELSFAVAKATTLEALRQALKPALGDAIERKSLLGGARLEWVGSPSAEAKVRGGKASLRFGTRIKGARVAEAVEHLAGLPGAKDLKLTATVRRFLPRPEAAPQG